MILRDGNIKVVQIIYESRIIAVYNLTVADVHNYYIGNSGVLVHNSDIVCDYTVTVPIMAPKIAELAKSRIYEWHPKDKHLSTSTAKRSAKFADSIDPHQAVIQALDSLKKQFFPNPGKAQDDPAFRVITDLGYPVGTKGQTKIRVIIGIDGKIWNAFPVN